MRKLSRRQKENLTKTSTSLYTNLAEAITLLKNTATAKFVESVELHANLNIDPKYADQQLRTTVTLPNGIGKETRIAVLTNDENFAEAEAAGANIVGNDRAVPRGRADGHHRACPRAEDDRQHGTAGGDR